MNIQAILQYKCRKCGCVSYGKEINLDNITLILQGVIDNGLITSEIKPYIIHQCKDGSYGISDLAGIDVRCPDMLLFHRCYICNKELFQGMYFSNRENDSFADKYYCAEHQR